MSFTLDMWFQSSLDSAQVHTPRRVPLDWGDDLLQWEMHEMHNILQGDECRGNIGLFIHEGGNKAFLHWDST